MSYQYIFLISLTQSTSLKFCFCILDFSAVDTNLFSLNSMNFSHRRKQILLSIKNPQKIISNQDIFFFKWSDWKPAQKPALRKTSKQNFLSFHSFDTLTINSLGQSCPLLQFWQIPHQRFAENLWLEMADWSRLMCNDTYKQGFSHSDYTSLI